MIFKYPGQKFVGIATRNADGSLKHTGFTLVDAIPKKGETLADREVSEVLTEATLLDERSRCAVNKIEAVAVLGHKVGGG
jgi:hypothetical protein